MTTEAGTVLGLSAITVANPATDRAGAIDQVGAQLVAAGLVTPGYVAAMHAREAIISTYLGNGIALPHGTSEAESTILGTGLAVAQYPDGVPWGDEAAHLVIGLAAKSEEHIGILSRLANVLEDAELRGRLGSTTDPAEIYEALTSDSPPPIRTAREPRGGTVQEVRIMNPHGLHARPAAEIVERMMSLDAEVTIVSGDREASAISITQLIGLGAGLGDDVTVTASGDDAEAAVKAVLDVLLADGEMA